VGWSKSSAPSPFAFLNRWNGTLQRLLEAPAIGEAHKAIGGQDWMAGGGAELLFFSELPVDYQWAFQP
jgi:hypothetical protein